MIDVAILRERPDDLKTALARRGLEVDVDRLVALDAERRKARAEAEERKAEQNRVSKEIATLDGDEKQRAIVTAGELGGAVKSLLADADRLDEEFAAQMVILPNMAHATAAEGLAEEDADEMRRWGDQPEFGFEAKDHLELGEALDVIDTERAAKVSGTRFGYLKGDAVLLEFALIRWGLDLLGERGFVPVVPPVLVREEALYGTGFFPGDSEQVYALADDDLFLVGTSEVPLAALHADEILDAEELPLQYAGFSTCFRREAGSYGRDTRGIFRVHQFDKLEMFVFCEPEDSWEWHDRLLETEEHIVQSLGLPHRVVNVAAGDLGASAAKKYDIEAWFPSMSAYREITSTSNTTDFQSRRLKIRYRGPEGNRLVHTLNGTAVAVGRTLLAILEHYQQEDGSVLIPEVLQPFMGRERISA